MERESVMRALAWTGSAAGVVAVVLRALSISGVGIVASLAPARVGFVLGSAFGTATVLRSAGLALLGWALHERRAWLLGGAVILGSYAVTGHPKATSSPLSLLVVVQVVHVAAVATWFGGVVFLASELRRRRRQGDPRGSAIVVARFSTIAGVMVACAAATGTLLARSQLASVDALWTTAYGRALLAKLGCVALVLALGAYNRQFLVPAIDRRDDRRAWERFRRTCIAEALVMALGVLVATAAMTSGGI
jgi:copper transport protein